MKKPAWIKAGHRTMKHRGYPRMVVRFTNDTPKPKLLENETEFNQREITAGRDPQVSLAGLVKHATDEWNKLKGTNNAS